MAMVTSLPYGTQCIHCQNGNSPWFVTGDIQLFYDLPILGWVHIVIDSPLIVTACNRAEENDRLMQTVSEK